MKILFLGYKDSPLIDFIKESGDEVIVYDEKLTADFIKQNKPDFLISYGYRHIIKQEILDFFAPNRAINMHISFLPWNRGADPNLWSFLDDTPKGVTIHYLDSGLDTGDIVAQEEVFINEEETLSSSYNLLHNRMINLFIKNWKLIKTGRCNRIAQVGDGTCHKSKDKEKIISILPDGWNTKISELKNIKAKNE